MSWAGPASSVRQRCTNGWVQAEVGPPLHRHHWGSVGGRAKSSVRGGLRLTDSNQAGGSR